MIETYVPYRLLLMSERINSIAEDQGSGRIDIYLNTINLINEFSIFQLLFGTGAFSFNQISWNSSAHNGFLQILFEFGLIGEILFIVLFVNLFKRLRYLRRNNSFLYQSYFSAIIVFFIMTMVSDVFATYLSLLFIFSYFGTVEGCIRHEKWLKNAQQYIDKI